MLLDTPTALALVADAEVSAGRGAASGPVSAGELAAELGVFRDRLAGADVAGLSDAQRVDLIRAAEEVAAAAAGVQVAVTADLAVSQSAAGASARGVAAQVGLAGRRSAQRAERDVAFARTVTAQMPHTLSALRAGQISQWRARVMVRETEGLSAEDRRAVDETLCADPEVMDGWGDAQAGNEARKASYRLDPHAVVARAAHAAKDRYVSCRPAPDTMTRITAMVPVTDGVAVYAALAAAADTARCAGDQRSRSQVMADELVTRTTGRPATTTPVPEELGREHPAGSAGPADDDDRVASQRPAGSTEPVAELARSANESSTGLTLTLNMVITDRALIAGDHEPAHLDGYGAVPAGWARARIAEIIDQTETDPATAVLIRRLFTAPGSGDLVAMESRSRHAPRGLADVIRLRDQTCRIPFCDARIRHTDHLSRWRDGGPTSAANLSGTCEAHNYAHEDPGWTHTSLQNSDQRHTFTVTTPNGHTYTTTAPAPPGTAA